MARVAAVTDQGRRRSNQDSHGSGVRSTALGEVSLGVVCDGVGGLAQGEVASSTVVRAVERWFNETLDGLLSAPAEGGGEPVGAGGPVERGEKDAGPAGAPEGDGICSQRVMDSLDNLVASANASILRYAAAHGGKMGTTLSALLCARGRFLAVQVGDSRVYHVTPTSARLVTEDQTLAARDVLQGRMTRDEARASDRRSVLLQAIGSQESILPIFYEGSYEPGDLFVLMSDGAWHQQEAAGVTQAFSPLTGAGVRDLELACHRVVKRDLGLGESDNLTVLVLGPEE